MGPGIEDFIAKGKAEKAHTRFSLAPSAVSTLPEYGYASLDQPPPFSKRNTLSAGDSVGSRDAVSTEEGADDEGDVIPETTSSQGRLTPSSRDGLGSDVGHAI